jgi:deoxycytidylate deaminase
MYIMESFIKIATEQSRHSDSHHKHGSVLICKNQVFTGYNHFAGCKTCVTVHAEEHAINNFISWCRIRCYPDNYIRRKLKKSILFTIRVKDDCIKYSPPCRECIMLIKHYEIKHIIYSEQLDDKTSLVSKKVRDLNSARPSSGYRSKERCEIARNANKLKRDS